MNEASVAAEKARLEKSLAGYRNRLAATRSKLADERFLRTAPADVVIEQRVLSEMLDGHVRETEQSLSDLLALCKYRDVTVA